MSRSHRSRARSEDWHWADVKAELEKRGLTLSRLAEAHGYAEKSFSQVRRRRWPQVEQIIAANLDRTPAEIWPSRYRIAA